MKHAREIVKQHLSAREPEQVSEMIYLLAQGYTKTQVAEKIQITRPTINNWTKEIKNLERRSKIELLGNCIMNQIKPQDL